MPLNEKQNKNTTQSKHLQDITENSLEKGRIDTPELSVFSNTKKLSKTQISLKISAILFPFTFTCGQFYFHDCFILQITG